MTESKFIIECTECLKEVAWDDSFNGMCPSCFDKMMNARKRYNEDRYSDNAEEG